MNAKYRQFAKSTIRRAGFRVLSAALAATCALMVAPAVLAIDAGAQSETASCSIPNGAPPTSIGTVCTREPACVVVGQTHMLVWKSRVPEKVFVVCIHGLGLCARAYQPLAKDFSEAGIDGFAVNVRGFGPDRDKPDRAKLDCSETVEDVQKLLVSIRKEQPGYRIVLIGESLGGALALRIAAENPNLVDGLVCSAPAWKILRMHRDTAEGVLEMVLFPGSYPGPLGQTVMHQATSDAALRQHWLTDPSHKLRLSLKEATSFLRFISKADKYAKQLTKPVLIVQGLDDHLVSPGAVAKLFRDIPSNNKTFLIDAKGEHLLLEEGRFSPPLIEILVHWIKSGCSLPNSDETIKVVNEQELSAHERHRLLELEKHAGSNTK